MHKHTAFVEHWPDTGLHLGYIPKLPGAHHQGTTLDELNANLTCVKKTLFTRGHYCTPREAIAGTVSHFVNRIETGMDFCVGAVFYGGLEIFLFAENLDDR